MSRWWITSPTVFYSISALLVTYVLYMMIMKRKGERPGHIGNEPEL